MMISISLKRKIELYLPLFFGIIIGLLCYFFDYIIKENMSFISIFLLIFLISFYLQNKIISSFSKERNIMNDIGNSVIIVIHSFVIWTILLNIF